jgi:hypothetical protein
VRQVGAWVGYLGVGDAKTLSWGGQTIFGLRELDRLSHIRRMIIGVAGALAEQVWCNRFNEHRIDVADCLDMDGFMSPTDWDVCGVSVDEWPPKLALAGGRVIDLLTGELRSEWLRVSRVLMHDGILVSADASKELADRVVSARQRAIANATCLT